MLKSKSLTQLAATVLSALLGVVFVALGLRLACSGSVAVPGSDAKALSALRLFGVRDAFLGFFVLVLLVTRERRALFLLLLSTIALPLADTVALSGVIGWSAAARANLPYEVPLLLVVFLLRGESSASKP